MANDRLLSFPSFVRVAVAIAGLVLSAAALIAAPAVLPESYSWVTHTTSESAAQATTGAWLGRLGLLLFGLSVLLIAARPLRDWSRWASVFHATFGVLMVASAAFATRSWDSATPFDPTEDTLHSVTATAMGFAFAFGVVALLIRGTRSRLRRLFDAVAVCASVLLPLGMTAWPDVDGVLQRVLFAIAYLWYGAEAGRQTTAA